MTPPIASLAARTCAAVVSAARTIMSSSFSRLSLADVTINQLQGFVAPPAFRRCKNQTCTGKAERTVTRNVCFRSQMSKIKCTLFCCVGDYFGTMAIANRFIIFSRAAISCRPEL
jgi:hypothetical protein